MAIQQLLNTEESGFEAGTTGGWTAVGNCTLNNFIGGGQAGTHSLAMNATASGDMQAVTLAFYGVSAGSTYVESAWYYSGTARHVQARIQWFDATGASISISSADVIEVANTWTQVSLTAVAPATAVTARALAFVQAPGAGELHYLDSVVFGPLVPQPNAYCASPAQLTLGLPGGPGLDLMSGQNGYRISSFDLGYPAARDDVANLPQRSGVVDQTKYYGPRAVSFGGSVVASAQGSRQQALEALGKYLNPAARPTLTYQVDGDVASRVVSLRGADLAAAYQDAHVSAFTAGFKSTDPCLYDATTHVLAAYASPATSALPATAGDQIVYPLLRVYGPAAAISIAVAPGAGAPTITITFVAAWTLGATTYVDIDCNAHTVLINGDPAQPAWNQIASMTGWPYLTPAGNGQVSWNTAPSGVSGNTRIECRWRDGFLL